MIARAYGPLRQIPARMHSRPISSAHRILWVSLVLGGCVAEIEEAPDADEDAVLDHVEALGYPREAAEVHEEHVTIGGDVLFDRDALVRGEYERFRPSGAIIEKGYARTLDLVAEAHQANIKLVFATGKHAPSKKMRGAFAAAATAWSEVPGSAIRISTKNSGPSIIFARSLRTSGADTHSVEARTPAPRSLSKAALARRSWFAKARSGTAVPPGPARR